MKQMAMILGILLVMVSGCIVSATPDPEDVIQASVGETLDFQVFGPMGPFNTPVRACEWRVCEWK
jgi:hypothetical protein